MMQPASVGRPRTSGPRKDRSRAAAFAYFVAKLNGWKLADYDDRFERVLKVPFTESEARASARALRKRLHPRSPYKNWLLVDAATLGLETMLITFPGTGGDRSDLMTALGGLDGIRQLILGEATGTVVAVAVVRNRKERQDLRAQIRELSTEPFNFEPVLTETHEPTLRTWAALTHREVEAERQSA